MPARDLRPWTGQVLAIAVVVGTLTASAQAGLPPDAPFDPRDPALVCRGMSGGVGRSPALRSMAADLAHNVQLAQAGKVNVEDELDLFEKLGLMEGHLMIGKALLDARMMADGLPHFGHPVSEIYDYLKPVFKERNYPEFEAELRDLEARARSAPDAAATAKAYDDVIAKIGGLRRTIPTSLGTSSAFVVQGIALMVQASADDLAESIEKGRIANSVEYHDGMGFARYAATVLDANRAMLGGAAGKIGGELQLAASAFPSLKPPEGAPPRTPADLTAAAGRVKELAQ